MPTVDSEAFWVSSGMLGHTQNIFESDESAVSQERFVFWT